MLCHRIGWVFFFNETKNCRGLKKGLKKHCSNSMSCFHFCFQLCQLDLETWKSAEFNVQLQANLFRGPDVGSRSGLQPLSWPVSSGSMFTGLALAASWKEIKASERTTDSSLITTSLSFTNTSGTNYALYCLHAGEGRVQKALWWAVEIVCQICFSPLMPNPEQGKDKKKKSQCHKCCGVCVFRKY